MKTPEVNRVSRVLAEKATGCRKLAERIGAEQQARLAEQLELKKAMDEKALSEVRAAPEINEVGVWGVGVESGGRESEK